MTGNFHLRFSRIGDRKVKKKEKGDVKNLRRNREIQE